VTLRDVHSAPEGMAANVASSAGEVAGGSIDDETYLDLIADRALAAVSDGVEYDVEGAIAERPHLAARIRDIVALTHEVAVRGAPKKARIGGYEIERELGRGGMGTVYLARQAGIGRRVALKVLPGTSRLSERTRQRFLAEAQALGKLGHPHVVSIHEVIESPDACAFAMEWVEGSDLQSVIEFRRADPERDTSAVLHFVGKDRAEFARREPWAVFVTRLGVGIARALAAAHRAGLLHRDVKPSNILLRNDGTALLSDFGLARDEDSARLTETGRFVGTLAYAPPEQIRGDAVDVRSDVYSLGVTLYHALALELPFRGASPEAMLRRIENGVAQPLRKFDPRIPRDLATIVAKAMEVDATRRYATADELADDLERFLRHEPTRAVPDALVTRAMKFTRRNRRTVVAALVATVITTAAAALGVARYLEWKERPARAAAWITTARQKLADPESRVRAAYPAAPSLRVDAIGHDGRVTEALALYDAAIELTAQAERIHAERAAVAAAAFGADYIGSDERAAGIAAFLSGKSQIALDRWTAASIDGPVDPLVEVFLAQWKLEHGEPAAAYAHLLRVEREWPEAKFVRLDLADAALQLGDVGGAQQWLAPLSFRDCAGNISKRILLRLHSEVAEAKGDLGLAEALDEILATRYGATTQSTLGHARRLASLGRPWEAIEILGRMRQWNPRPPTWERDAREILVAAAQTLTRADLARSIFSGRGGDTGRVPDLGMWFSVCESVSTNGEESTALDLDDSAPNPHGVSLRDLRRIERVSEMSRSLPNGVRQTARMLAVFPESSGVAIATRIAESAPRLTVVFLAGALGVDAFGQTELFHWDGAGANAQFGTDVANAGDVNNDGYDDIVVGAFTEAHLGGDRGSATVYSGATGGLLYKWYGDAAGDQFGFSVVGLGDLNGDDFGDIAIGTRGSNLLSSIGYVRVFSGQSGAPLYSITGASAGDVFGYNVDSIGDIDNDGKSDFGVCASGNGTANYAKVYSGATGTLLFSYSGGVSLGVSLTGIDDLNGDGFRDFAISDIQNAQGTGVVHVRSGQTGALLHSIAGQSFNEFFGNSICAIDDQNGDGKQDLLIGAPGVGAGRISVHSGANGLQLASAIGTSAGDYFGGNVHQIPDMDSDGKRDFAISAWSSDVGGSEAGRVYLLSSALLTTITTIDGEFAGDYFSGGMASADTTGDGEVELLIGASQHDAGGSNSGRAYVYSLIEGCSTTLPHYDVGVTPRDILLVDRDSDGDRDAVSANSGDGTLTVLTNDGQGDFSAAASTITLGVGDDPQSIVTQGAGLAVACPSTNAVRQLTASAGSWTYSGTTLSPPGQRPVDLASGDLDGAGGVDLAIALEGSVFGIGGGVAVSLGGAPTMLAAPPGGFLSMKRVAIGDLDGDGDQDIVAGMTGTAFVAGPSANVLLYENNGTGTFSYVGALTGGGVPSGFALRNLDGDNDVDLMVIAQAVPPFGTTSGLTVFKNNGTGSLGPSRFTGLSQLAAGSLPGDMVSLDLNSDSLPGFLSLEDVVVADTTGSTFKGFRSFGSTSFASTEDLEADDTPVALAAGDLNADGIPDLVAVNAGCDSMTVSLSALNALTQKFGTGCAGTGGKVPAISAVGSPTFGNPSFGVKLTNARAASFVYFGISLNYVNAPLGGCTLYLTPPVSFFTTFTNGLGQSQINLGIPNAVPPFVGLNAYFQYFVNDPVGGYSGFAFSDALRIRLGN
jgi:serine/threonine protein kinase